VRVVVVEYSGAVVEWWSEAAVRQEQDKKIATINSMEFRRE
jgi:hypothetical protein